MQPEGLDTTCTRLRERGGVSAGCPRVLHAWDVRVVASIYTPARVGGGEVPRGRRRQGAHLHGELLGAVRQIRLCDHCRHREYYPKSNKRTAHLHSLALRAITSASNTPSTAMHPRERRKLQAEESGIGGADDEGGVGGSDGGAWSELASSSYGVEPLQKPEHTFSHSFFTAQETAGACLRPPPSPLTRRSLAPGHHALNAVRNAFAGCSRLMGDGWTEATMASTVGSYGHSQGGSCPQAVTIRSQLTRRACRIW